MPLVAISAMLKHATENRYGVPAINTFNFETVKYAILAAEKAKKPIIVQFYPGLKEHCPEEVIVAAARAVAKDASVPVALHLDHSATFELAVEGIQKGFDSVMVDGSSLLYEENVSLTRRVKDVAKVFGCDIEAELGHVGSGSSADDFMKSDMFTRPDQALDFVEKTECDALAIAVGNAHGAYVRTPNLDFDRIAALRAAVPIPLVMHGCSDIPREQLREAVRLGMSKFNIATEYFRAMGKLSADLLAGAPKTDGYGVLTGIGEGMMDFVTEKLELLNPNYTIG